MGGVLQSPVNDEDLEAWAELSLKGDQPADAPAADRRADPSRIGEYELITRIGTGGMGTVYRAFQPSLRREVALKKLNQSENEISQERFHARNSRLRTR